MNKRLVFASVITLLVITMLACGGTADIAGEMEGLKLRQNYQRRK